MADSLLNKLVPSATLESIKVDWVRVGLALVVARLVTQQPLSDKNWQWASLLTLLGFTIYNLLTARVVDTGSLASGRTRTALDDLLKVGTMLVASRVLAGGSLTDENWMRESAYTLVGFTTFNLGVARVTDGLLNFENRVNVALDTGAKFATMHTVSRWLAGGAFSREWALESAAFTAGLMAYDYMNN